MDPIETVCPNCLESITTKTKKAGFLEQLFSCSCLPCCEEVTLHSCPVCKTSLAGADLVPGVGAGGADARRADNGGQDLVGAGLVGAYVGGGGADVDSGGGGGADVDSGGADMSGSVVDAVGL